ncbi:endonuclease/exonuclease/phosphatase family protein [Nocardia sp. MDA0666]|uniref:endonuclease/exonuclease/phosphatase family protein n=1 Tax=Nocardia sp. MDA0666 TaxID=2135448 RepID=UPI001E3E8FD2|nr:endonuclease/exonuclease/phosphatase family protein [Nocardia sp. MDA0666]
MRRMKAARGRIALESLAVVATLVGAGGVALHFNRTASQWLVLAASGAPYLMCAAVVGVALFAAAKRWAGVAVAIAVVGVAIWTQAPLYVGRSPGDHGTPVTVMQANLLFDGADPHALIEQVRERKVGILTVEELTPAAVHALEGVGLDRLLPHRYLSPGRTATGTGIWSAYSLSDTVEYDGFVLNQLSATATVPGVGPVSVYAFHPVPPISGTHLWADELSRLRAILDRSPTDRPVIVGGDFNATFDHAQFRAMLSDRFHDAAEQEGAGHLVTYPTDKRWPPLVGIDHILVADGHADTVDTVRLPGADHKALIAHLRLTHPQ